MRTSGRTLFLALALSAGLVLTAPSLSAAQFSADFTVSSAKGSPPGSGAAGKLNVGAGVVRVEAANFPSGRFIVDLDAGTALFVMPARRLLMDAKQSSRLTQILVPVNPKDPCPAWRAAAKIAGEPVGDAERSCQRLPSEIVAGRVAIGYRVTSVRATDYAWIDPEISFPVKYRFSDGGEVSLSNIRQGLQPAALFAVPGDYHKFEPQGLIDRIKQSDVWVDRPK